MQMLTVSTLIIGLQFATAATTSLLHRVPRHLHSENPVNINSQVASPPRCSTTSLSTGLQIGYLDEIVEYCNSTYCAPPKIVSFQRPCPAVCNNGGTLKGNGVECDCPDGFFGAFCENRALCGRLMLAAEGTISLEIPFIAVDLKCVWEIRTVAPNSINGRPGHRIILAAEEFNIPPLQVTEEDIYNGGYHCPKNNRINLYQDKLAPGYSLRRGGYCGENSFQTVISEGNVLFVELLLSVNFNTTSNFTFSYKTLPNVPRYLCQSSWTLNSFRGTLQTSGYPLQMPPRMRCTWALIVRPGYTLQLDFANIDLDEPHLMTNTCESDSITALSENRGEVEILCGSISNKVLQFEDPGKVYLLLVTDAVRQGKGFKVHFTHIKQQR